MDTTHEPSEGTEEFQKRYLAGLRAFLRPAREPRRGAAGGRRAGAPRRRGGGPAGGGGPAPPPRPPPPPPGAAPPRLGKRAHLLGIGTLALARIHDHALAALAPPAPGSRGRRSRTVRAASFFADAIAPIEATHRPAVDAVAELGRLGLSLDRGVVELATAHRRLSRETGLRKDVEGALAASEADHRALVKRSRQMEERLRQLSRSLLRSHEDERRRISRELHDALGQTLTAVNVGLAALKAESTVDSKGYRNSVSKTQRLVQKSMRTVHRFARDLRPALLDDLGLVPALVGFTREFAKVNGIAVEISAAEEPARLDGDSRTALFRVAQEALVNLGRHSGARRARVTLRRTPDGIALEVWDNGKGFDVARVNGAPATKHLGLLCMRERMDMVGGTLSVRSSRKAGTVVRAEVPLPVNSLA